jgi:hypothetical protein
MRTHRSVPALIGSNSWPFAVCVRNDHAPGTPPKFCAVSTTVSVFGVGTQLSTTASATCSAAKFCGAANGGGV